MVVKAGDYQCDVLVAPFDSALAVALGRYPAWSMIAITRARVVRLSGACRSAHSSPCYGDAGLSRDLADVHRCPPASVTPTLARARPTATRAIVDDQCVHPLLAWRGGPH